MNKIVTLAEAKAHISALVTEVAIGGEVTIIRHGRPVARLVGAPTKTRRTAGDWGWQGEYDPSVFAPMAETELDSLCDIEPDDSAESSADQTARAQIAAGQGIPHAEMMAWFQTWGKPGRPPRPRARPE